MLSLGVDNIIMYKSFLSIEIFIISHPWVFMNTRLTF